MKLDLRHEKDMIRCITQDQAQNEKQLTLKTNAGNKVKLSMPQAKWPTTQALTRTVFSEDHVVSANLSSANK